jgi:hypothetical protein
VSFIRFQVDGSTGVVHCYPVSEVEVRSDLGVTGPLPYDSESQPIIRIADVIEAMAGT